MFAFQRMECWCQEIQRNEVVEVAEMLPLAPLSSSVDVLDEDDN